MAPKRDSKKNDNRKKQSKETPRSSKSGAPNNLDTSPTNEDPEAPTISQEEPPTIEDQAEEPGPSAVPTKRDSAVLGNIDPTVSAPPPIVPTTTTTIRTTKEPVIPPSTPCKTSCGKECCNYIYNGKNRTVCERTFSSWMKIIGYSTIYLIFLLTFTMICLFSALSIIKANTDFDQPPDILLKTGFVTNGVGLHVTPMFENDDTVIRFRTSDECDFFKFINPIEDLLKERLNDFTLISSLGPCGINPYGYGENPCVIIKIDDPDWHDESLNLNSTLTPFAPEEVQSWMRSGAKILWLHCHGYSKADRDNIGKIIYYPYPPGFDEKVFPLGSNENPPLVAVQFTKLKLNIPITVVCQLWHEHGPSSVYFTLHIESSKEIATV